MGQILNRIINIAKSNRTNISSTDSFFEQESDELKKIIDELNSYDNKEYSAKEEAHLKRNNMTMNRAYEILKIENHANNDEIKKAYIERIKEYHPDRLENFGDDLKELAIKRTQEINQAYSLIKSGKSDNDN